MDPRRPLDETKLAELADQVWQHGLCNPYWFSLCRKAKLDRDRSGFCASKPAKRETIPECVRVPIDTACESFDRFCHGQHRRVCRAYG
jgi:hypothetical protein